MIKIPVLGNRELEWEFARVAHGAKELDADPLTIAGSTRRSPSVFVSSASLQAVQMG